MNFSTIFSKLNFKCAKFYTLLLRKSFGECGKGTVAFFPNRFLNPSCLMLKNNVTLSANSWFNIVKNWDGKQYNGMISIGSNSVICSFVQISAAKSVSIGNNVTISKGTTIVDHIHDYKYIDRPISYNPLSDPKSVVIEENSFVGTNCFLAPGVHIGRHAFVGANSVVLGRVPDFTVVAGNPASIIRKYNKKTDAWERV